MELYLHIFQIRENLNSTKIHQPVNKVYFVAVKKSPFTYLL